MRKIELVGGISSSVLGFGCAPVLGSVGAAKSRRALEVALDCGINHFDLARSYGYGEAEKFVGQIMQGRRDKVILASKFGIRANWKARLLRPMKPLARQLRARQAERSKTHQPALSDQKPGFTDKFHDRIEITSLEMRRNLEQSLSALKTDYLDYLFVHEPTASIKFFDVLAETAEILKKEGKIRAWGLSFMNTQEDLHKDYLERFDILQFDTPNVKSKVYDQVLNERGIKSNILFSPFRNSNFELSPAQRLKSLLNNFPKSIILCSMFDENHIRSNANVIEEI